MKQPKTTGETVMENCVDILDFDTVMESHVDILEVIRGIIKDVQTMTQAGSLEPKEPFIVLPRSFIEAGYFPFPCSFIHGSVATEESH